MEEGNLVFSMLPLLLFSGSVLNQISFGFTQFGEKEEKCLTSESEAGDCVLMIQHEQDSREILQGLIISPNMQMACVHDFNFQQIQGSLGF